jgi:hypothetical protein
MKSPLVRKSIGRLAAVAGIGLCATSAWTSAAVVYQVSINTASLLPDSIDMPFSLQLELIGGGTPTVSNTATFGNFHFSTGSAGDASSIFETGDVSNDASLSNGVTLDTDNGAASVFSQYFSPGSTLSFTVDTTENLIDATTGPYSPDGLSIQILDSAFNAVPTEDPDGTGSLVMFTYADPLLTTATYASDPTQPTTGGEFLSIPAPTVTAVVPEPTSMAFVAVAGLITLRRRARTNG